MHNSLISHLDNLMEYRKLSTFRIIFKTIHLNKSSHNPWVSQRILNKITFNNSLKGTNLFLKNFWIKLRLNNLMDFHNFRRISLALTFSRLKIRKKHKITHLNPWKFKHKLIAFFRQTSLNKRNLSLTLSVSLIQNLNNSNPQNFCNKILTMHKKLSRIKKI